MLEMEEGAPPQVATGQGGKKVIKTKAEHELIVEMVLDPKRHEQKHLSRFWELVQLPITPEQ